jgi:cation:H+ antiporter
MGSEEKVMGIPQLIHFQTLVTTGSLFLAIVAIRFLSRETGYDSLLITFVIVCLALGLLIYSADFFIEGAKGLARRGGLPEVVIGLTVVSIGTSLPEIMVTTASAADGLGDLAISGILGSVLVQITLIMGIVVVNKGLKIRESWLKRDGLIMLLAVLILTFFLLTDLTLERWESGILVMLYVAYITWLLMHRKVIQLEEDENKEEVGVHGSRWTNAANVNMVIFGLAFAVFAADQLVKYAELLALDLNVPHAIIGVTASGIGTSLPELTIALMAAKRSQGVAIGTLIGSNITDPLLSIGVAGLVRPLAIQEAGFELIVYIIIPFTILGCMMALIMMRTSYEFKKWEGYTLILVYILFLVTLEAYNRSWITF